MDVVESFYMVVITQDGEEVINRDAGITFPVLVSHAAATKLKKRNKYIGT